MLGVPPTNTSELSASTARNTSNLTFCVNCQACFRDRPGTRHKWETTYGVLKRSARECRFCHLQLSYSSYPPIAREEIDSAICNEAILSAAKVSGKYDLKIQSRCGKSSTEFICNLFEVPTAATGDPAYTTSPTGTRVTAVPSSCGLSTDAETSLDLVRSWARECHDNHVKCRGRPIQSVSDMPTRVLDVGDGEQVHLQLVESRHLAVGTEYMTLSHCWGGLKIMTLQQSSFEKMKTQIDQGKLTMAFQHAIEYTRRMRIRYLWIDSLCIIQDSLKDWQQEAARMGSYYQKSWCNLAASKARNGNEGCFSKRTVADICPLRVQVEWEAGSRKTFLVLRDTFQDIFSEIHRSPLADRAWTVQELLLAPRVLFFGEKQLFWECHELQACESWPAGFVGITRLIRLRPKSILGSGSAKEKSRLDIHNDWMSIVHSYTVRKLTKPGDKLIALSGIAQVVLAYGNDEYLAGIWKSDLHRQLLWTTGGLGTRPETYRAPSWSWASVDGEVLVPFVEFHERGRSNMLTLLGSNISTVGESPTGQVKDGALLVKCSMAKGLILAQDIKFGDRSVTLPGYTQLVIHDIPSSNVVIDCSDIPSRTPAYFVPVLVHNIKYLEGLILLPTGLKKGEYRRQGNFSITPLRKDEELCLSRWKLLPRTGGIRDDHFVKYLGVDDKGLPQYIISIV